MTEITFIETLIQWLHFCRQIKEMVNYVSDFTLKYPDMMHIFNKEGDCKYKELWDSYS